MKFQRVACIDSGIYQMGITPPVLAVYFYLSARCASRFHVSEAEIVRAVRLNVHRVRECIAALVEIRLVHRWTFPRPKCTEYLVTLSTEKGWGIGLGRAHSIGLRRAPLTGSGKPHNGAQVSPPPITNDSSGKITGDSQLLSLFKAHFGKWTFNRKPIGTHFHFTRPMLSKAVECMRSLNGRPGFSTQTAFDEFLTGCGEYLSLPRDVLNPGGRDQRALSPVQWLNQWDEQTRLAGIFLDEKREKITRMAPNAPLST